MWDREFFLGDLDPDPLDVDREIALSRSVQLRVDCSDLDRAVKGLPSEAAERSEPLTARESRS